MSGFLQRMFAPPAVRALVDDPVRLGFVRETAAGVVVSELGALQVSAVYAAVRILAESVAGLPLVLYERTSDGKRRATGERLYTLLHNQPNPEITAFEMRETLMAHLALWGNAYCEIERDRAGRVLWLWPLRPDRMTVSRMVGDNSLKYSYQLSKGGMVTLSPDRVWHLRGLSLAGVVGISPIAAARQAVGLSVAAEEFGARFFGNGARPGGVLTHPGILSDEAYAHIRESWENVYGGLSNAQRVAILEEGVTYQQISVPPEDAQFLETRKFQVTEIARIFRVPPHMLGDLDRATFSNIEQQSLEFVMHTLRPWLVRIEQSIWKDLIPSGDRGRLYAEHLVEGLLRGDIGSRYAAYATGRQNGWLSANDIRSLENLNKIEGGDVYLVPLNMVPATSLAEGEDEDNDDNGEGENEARGHGAGCGCGRCGGVEARGRETAVGLVTVEQRTAAGDRSKLATGQMPVFVDLFRRIVKREGQDIAAAARRFGRSGDLLGFRQWLGEFWDGHKGTYERMSLPVMAAYASAVVGMVAREVGEDVPDEVLPDFLAAYVEALGVRNVARHEASVERLIERAQAEGEAWDEVVAAEVVTWAETRPEGMAHEEVVRANNAVALAAYGWLGYLRKTWVTVGEDCPFCERLNGQTLRLEAFFVEQGGDVAGDAGQVLNVSGNVGHPPAHRGCDCMVVASRGE